MNEFCIVGAGKLASSIVNTFHYQGLYFDSVIDINRKNAEHFAKLYEIKKFSTGYGNIKNSGLIFLAVPDSQILPTVEKISAQYKNLKEKIFVHFSGSLTCEVLEPLEKKGASIAAVHPMQTFPSMQPVKLNKVYCAVETHDAEIRKSMFLLFKKMGMIPFDIKPEFKTVYHMLGVFASNFMVANMKAAEILGENIPGLPPVEKLLANILKQTQENILQNGIDASLSGPVQRGDEITIQKHLKELGSSELLKNLYSSATEVLREMVKK